MKMFNSSFYCNVLYRASNVTEKPWNSIIRVIDVSYEFVHIILIDGHGA